MREALYRKYRPKSLDEVVGQPHITRTLKNAIESNRISHGYLFAGPRGVGKTSVARILAHQVNNFNYGDSQASLDIIEIDAASNRRIEEIRDLRDKVHTAPVAGKYKVYIIDEVHMLTREAFNALLKTLEEPPAHVIFILATTEVHKLPETIISRTQHFSFKTVSSPEISKHLQNIAKQENINISSEPINMISELGQGSFRDSLTLLDQLSTLKKINNEHIEKLLGLPPAELVNNLFDSLNNNDLKIIVDSLSDATSKGISASQISNALVEKIRLSSLNSQSRQLINLGKSILTINSSIDPMKYLELTLIDYVLSTNEGDIKLQKNKIKKPIKQTPASNIKPPTKSSTTITKKQNENQINTEKTKPSEAINPTDTYDKLLNNLKSKHNTLYGIARMATPSITGDTLVLQVDYPFHQKRLSEEKNSKIIRLILSDITGQQINLKVETNTMPKESEQPPEKLSDNSDTLETVTQIFGGGEVLEA